MQKIIILKNKNKFLIENKKNKNNLKLIKKNKIKLKIIKNKLKLNKNKLFFAKNNYFLIKKTIFQKIFARQKNNFLINFFK